MKVNDAMDPEANKQQRASASSSSHRQSNRAASARPPEPQWYSERRSVVSRLRDWIAQRLSIRQRLTLWYASMLTFILTALSAVTFTVAQNQIQNNLNADIRMRAVAIAKALQHEEYTSSGGSTVLPPITPAPGAPSPTVTIVKPTATPKATPVPTKAPSASVTPSATATSTPDIITTPASTPDPATNAAIQRQLTFAVPDVLGRLDLGFEVLDTQGRLKYLAPSLNNHSLPVRPSVVDNALRGTPGAYNALTSDHVLLAVYAQPIVIDTHAFSHNADTNATTAPTSATSAGDAEVVGVVLVAKSQDDVNGALSTLVRILLIGELVAIFCATLGGWLIAESGLRPITNVTRAASAIARDASAAGLGTRVPYRGAKDEIGELVSTFNEMLASIEQVANAQRRFVADASHELRAPLTTIRGNLELLRQAWDLPEADRSALVDDAYLEAERMTSLVGDLLLLARVDAATASRGRRSDELRDQLMGRREPVELDQLVMDLFRAGQAQLRVLRKQVTLSVTTLAPVTVIADPGQLRQLGMILLDNALKYTPSGGQIRLAISQNGPLASLTVTDTGIGISPEDLPHIFERFFRADRARERDEHGSGLGLAIARWIAEAHQGEIKVESIPGKGSVFTVLLPIPRGLNDQSFPRIPTGRRKRVRPNPIQLSAIKPLARFAQSVSRPRTEKEAHSVQRAMPAEEDHPETSGAHPRRRRSNPPGKGL